MLTLLPDQGAPADGDDQITPNKPGRIRFGGTSWSAYTLDGSFGKGDKVAIIRREGMKYLVTGSITGLPGGPLVEPPGDSTPSGDTSPRGDDGPTANDESE